MAQELEVDYMTLFHRRYLVDLLELSIDEDLLLVDLVLLFRHRVLLGLFGMIYLMRMSDGMMNGTNALCYVCLSIVISHSDLSLMIF